jgi:hypothetical protein
MNIKLTDFAKRHFDQNFNGTKVLVDMKVFENYISKTRPHKIMDGYADFCKILVYRNTENMVRTGTMKISLETFPYIRSGYSARTSSELPVLHRWLELPNGIQPPIAEYLIVIVYSKEQLEKEDDGNFGADYGIVSIQGTNHPFPDPIPPITMLRNQLGIEYGGSGTLINEKEYLQSVEFWNNNILIK